MTTTGTEFAMDYLKRSITDVLLSRINNEQMVVITGARQTGKTTLCENLLPKLLNLPITYISFDDPDERLRFQHSAITILEYIETQLIILDEVQKIPSLFDPLKYVVDKQRKLGLKKIYILTGSSQLLLMLAPASNGPTCRRNMDPFSRFLNDSIISEKGTHPLVQ
jgi:predicted AAA+ superfamily ATPase